MGTLQSQENSPEEALPTESSGPWAMARRALMTVLLLGLLFGSYMLLVYIFQSCCPRPCETQVHSDLLARYQASGDTSVAPCTDFFSFACGNPNATSNSFQTLEEENKSRLQRILESPGSQHLGSGEEKAFQFYSSCMDTPAIEAAGAGPLRQVIEELGGWRISGHWTSLDFNRTLRLLMSQYDHFPFFRAYLGPHPDSAHTPVIQIDQPEFDVFLKQEQEQKISAQIFREYLTYLNRLGTLLGGSPDKVQEHASMSIAITSRLFQFLKPVEQCRAPGKLYHMVTIDQLQEMAPTIDWLSCLQATFTPMTLSPSQPLMVHDLEYLKNMSQLIEDELSKHRDFLQSHMIWGLVRTLSPALDSDFQEAYRELNQKLRELREQPPMNPTETPQEESEPPLFTREEMNRPHGGGTEHTDVGRQEPFSPPEEGLLEPAHPRWKTCVEKTGAFFEPTLAPLFVREAFGPSIGSAAMELFVGIKDAFLTRLKSLPWMSEEARKEAQDRVTKLQVEIGAPEWALKPELARQEYSDIQLGPSFLQSFLSCVRSLQARTVRSFLQPSPHHRWKVSPWGVNAYYSISDRVVVFPAGLLQPPFFHPDYPRAVNFGAAGSIMAQKLLHSLHQFLLPGGCQACDTHALQGARLCLERHYAAFPLPRGTSFNGSHTFLEDAADVGGLAIALQAYRKRLLGCHGDTTLPNLDLSPQQLFFRSYAQVMCTGSGPQDSQDTHSPPTLRVHGPLSNTPVFARHFHCPNGTLLNPSIHCQLW